MINNVSIRTIERLKRCQIVKGFVDIELTMDVCNDEQLLEALSGTLLSIVEIHKYLKISGTSITDLGFFTNLRRIRGVALESGNSLVLTNNKNLKRIWLPSQNVSVDRGTTQLENNPSFCNNEECDNESIQIEIESNSYYAKIKWNSANRLSNFKFNLWRENEYLEESFCQNENAE